MQRLKPLTKFFVYTCTYLADAAQDICHSELLVRWITSIMEENNKLMHMTSTSTVRLF